MGYCWYAFKLICILLQLSPLQKVKAGDIVATEYQKADSPHSCCAPDNTFHQRCGCSGPLSNCMQFCNEDENCKGYVSSHNSDKEKCQIATSSSCPSGCESLDVGNVGELLFNGTCGKVYGGCFIKNIICKTDQDCKDMADGTTICHEGGTANAKCVTTPATTPTTTSTSTTPTTTTPTKAPTASSKHSSATMAAKSSTKDASTTTANKEPEKKITLATYLDLTTSNEACIMKESLKVMMGSVSILFCFTFTRI